MPATGTRFEYSARLLGRALALASALLSATAFGEEPAAGAAAAAPRGEDVTFRTADGVSLAATWWPPAAGSAEPAPVVVALPMYRRTRETFAPMVGPVTERGMGLLAVDLRGHGGSAGEAKDRLAKRVEERDASLFNSMHLDVEAAIAWLTAQKKTRKGAVGLLGASVGCSVAIDTAVRNPDEVGAVACLTPGREYLRVPTMEHVEDWPPGKPLLLVASAAEAPGGAGPLQVKLEGKGAELRIAKAVDVPGPAGEKAEDPMALHGTNMFGKVPEVELHVADWLAYHVAFRRLDLGGGTLVRVGSTGASLYVGVETKDGAPGPASGLLLRIGQGPPDDPWSKAATIEIGKRLDGPTSDAPTRRRTRVSRERLGVEAGRAFAVQVSVDGTKWLPEATEPPLRVTLR